MIFAVAAALITYVMVFVVYADELVHSRRIGAEGAGFHLHYAQQTAGFGDDIFLLPVYEKDTWI